MLPLVLVAFAVGFNLITLHDETIPVAYLNDGSMHAEMVRFATGLWRHGQFPLTSWFPLLGEGSPQFIHYQSLGAILTGALGVAIGPDHAYAWVLYLVLATWPISIYLAMRAFAFDRLSAAMGAVISPFVVSTLGIGYEQQSYLSIGYGLWSQLLAMWTLPLAWGWSWQAMTRRRALLPAACAISATIALHYFTGYLAILGAITAFATSSTPIRERLRHAAELAIAVGAMSAWVIVPLLQLRPWASINEFLQHGPDVNSYGARQIMTWLVTGQLFDAHRLPVLTVAVGIGLVVIATRSVFDPRSRNLVALFVATLLLFFGRTTFGSLMRLIPGSEDLFLRRFLMGVQLAGIIAAGVGIVEGGRLARRGLRRLGAAIGAQLDSGRTPMVMINAGMIALGLVVAAPCVASIIRIDRAEAANIRFQQHADATAGAVIAPIISKVLASGGRVYAGLPVSASQIGGWGSSFTVGEVPVFKYLTKFNVDVVGYTLRTASLMTDPEAYFDEYLPSDFALFGVQWLIYPVDKSPPAGATRVMERGPYVLWRLHTSGYLQLVDTVSTITANRANIGAKTASFVRSASAGSARYPTIGFNGLRAPVPTWKGQSFPTTAPGRIMARHVTLGSGTASCFVSADRTSVVVLKASFDPGWNVMVDGHARPTEMIGPAYVGVVVGAGIHHVTFTYANNTHEALLLWILAAALIALILIHLRQRRVRPTTDQTAELS